VEKFSEFVDSLPKSTIVSLIAITIVILPIWIATGTPDYASQISFFLLAIALPMLVLEFILCQLPEIFFRSKFNKGLHLINSVIGTDAALVGVTAAIWHISQTVAKGFIISSVICAFIIVRIGRSFWLSLQKDKKQIEELKTQQDGLNKRMDELKTQIEELKTQPEVHQEQMDELEKQVDEFQKRFEEYQSILTTTANKYQVTPERNHA
jgi:hypothetical protein